jgi:hypothetical protein
MVESWVTARTNFELGENLTCELCDSLALGNRGGRGAGRRWDVPYGVVVIHKSLQTLTRISIPEASTRETLSAHKHVRRQPLHKAIHGARNNQGPVHVETNRSNGVRMGGKDFERFACRVP